MKKGIFLSVIMALLCLICIYLVASTPLLSLRTAPGSASTFHVEKNKIQHLENGIWTDFVVKGVNMGTGYPGVFPNAYGIPSDVYYRWFEMIADMNANTIRVYKIQSPEFYQAFCQYNQEHDKKLYLLQGIDFPENLMYSEEDPLETSQIQELISHSQTVVDALHGKKLLMDWDTGDFFCYTFDVSEYVMGYILGIEWDTLYVQYLCEINKDIPAFQGQYLYTEQGSNAFEIFLAEWMDSILAYEDGKYGVQKLISFCNWTETDPLKNDVYISTQVNQLDYYEAMIDTEHILCRQGVTGGIFASYNIYPYYPEFLQYGTYAQYIDEHNLHNPYRKYLMELCAHHSYPVVVTEYGSPSSRNAAYLDIWRGLSHGGHTETEQAMALLTMYEDISKAGCAGSLVFTWQDEWYKRTWNEMALSDPNGRAFWSNIQSAEQFYGIMAFDPGTPESIGFPDGDLTEWEESSLLSKNGNLELYMRSDEKYLSFLAKGFESESDFAKLCIALDITPKSGASSLAQVEFGRPVDFVIQIGRVSGYLQVHDYWDPLLYSLIEKFPRTTLIDLHQTDLLQQLHKFNNPNLSGFSIVSRSFGSIQTYIQHKLGIDAVGRLKHGNANPESPDYDSNADYFISGNAVEIRIPWQLLNFYDPSQCVILDDFHSNNYQIQGLKIDEIYAAAYLEGETQVTDFGRYPLEEWDTPQFHERLKPAYYALQEAFAKGEAS